MGRVEPLPGVESLSRRIAELERRAMSPGAPAIGCLLTASSATSLPNNNSVAITWDVENWDTAGMHDLVTNTSRITFRVPGYYVVGGETRIDDGSPSGFIQLDIFKDGTTTLAVERRHAISANFVTVNSYGLFAADDYIELRATQNSGGTLSTNAIYDRFWAHRVA